MFVSNIKIATNKVNIKKTKKSESSTSFSGLLSDVDEANTVSNIKSPNHLSSAVMLQEISNDEYQKKKTLNYGDKILDELENYNNSNLSKKDSEGDLNDLVKKLRNSRDKTTDPVLESLIDDIELRAAVEAAKKGE